VLRSQLPCRESLGTAPRALPWSTPEAPVIIKTVHVISETGRPQITFRTLNKSAGPIPGA